MGIEDRGAGDNSEIRLSVRDDQAPSGQADSFDIWIRPDSGTSYTGPVVIADPNDGNWHYAALQRDSSTARLYYDGAEIDSAAVGTNALNFPVTLLLGAQWQTDSSGQRNFFAGELDEIRTATTVRSADWLATEFANQSDPYAFYRILPEQVPADVETDLTGTQITLEAWVNVDTGAAAELGPMTMDGYGTGYRFNIPFTREVRIQLGENGTYPSSATTLSNETWYQIVGTYNATNMQVYVDGLPDGAPVAKPSPNLERSTKELWIGHGDHAIEQPWSFPWGGEVDEVRISDIARDANWIATQHNNQDSPATFHILSAEEPNGAFCGPDENTSTITALPTSIVGDGASTSTITVQLKDSFGNNLTAGGDTVLLFTDLGSLGSVTDNSDGTYTATLTSAVGVGTATITSTVNAVAITDNATVDFISLAWPDCTYLYRIPLTVTTGGSAVDASYSVAVSFDHASLVSAIPAKSVISGDDVRVFHWIGGGWDELDRALDPLSAWNDTNTKIWFDLADTIGTSSVDSNYQLVYGDSTPSAPPDEWANVFRMGDDFEDGAITAGLAITTAGAGSISETAGEAQFVGGAADADAAMLVDNNAVVADREFTIRHMFNLVSGATGTGSTPESKAIGIVESAAQPGPADSSIENPRRRIISYVRSNGEGGIFYYDTVGTRYSWDGAAWTTVGTPPWTSSLVLDTYYIHAIVSDGTQWFVKVSDATGSALTATDPVLWSTMQDLGDPYWFYIGDPYTNFYWNDTHSDWIYERYYVSPEPITGTGSEETNQAYCTQAADPATSLIMASPPSIPADGASTITVQLQDGFGNNLTSGGDTVLLFTTLGSLGSVTDNRNGTCTATLTSGLTEGIATITGTANGDAIADSAAVDLVVTGGSYNQCNYSFRKLITLQASQVTATQTNFPVLIDIPSDTDLEHTSNGGDVQSIFGTDIVFTAADGFTVLDYELEKYDPVTGEVVAWVEVPSLSSSANTNIYMYYGNASANNQQDVIGTWDEGGANNFAGVWHLSQDPSQGAPQFLNSFSAAYDGTANSLTTANQVNGQIDGSLSFDDSNERHVSVPHSAGLQFNSNMTISAWVRTSDSEPDTGLIITKWQGGGNSNYWLGKFDASNLAFYVDGSQNVTASLALINDGVWHHVVGVADVSNSLLRIYVDGTQANTAAYSGTSETGTSPLHIGNSSDSASQEWEDRIDEVRVSSAARDADWIATEHNNQSSPATFHLVGSEEINSTYCGADPATSTITANPVTITADGVSTSTMTVQLKDSFGTNLTTGGDAVLLFTDLGSLGSVSDNGNGTYTATLTSAVTPGTATITGTVNAAAIVDNATVNFTAVAWVQCDYQFRKSITINFGQVTGDQTNFPVLINLPSDSELAANARSDGFDIAFTDSTGLVQLDYEREEFDSNTGELVAWVRIPNLSSSVNTVIYLYYGDPDATDQANPVGVWDSNFQGVWHLEELVADEAVGGTHTDSSGTGNDGTQNNNGPVAGQIGGAQDFDGTADEITVSGFTGISSFPVTISAWSAATADNGSFRAAATIGTANDEYLGIGWAADPDPNEQTEIAARDTVGFQDMGGPIVSNNDWTHIVGVFVSTTERRLYVDGGLFGTDTVSVTEPSAYDKFHMGELLQSTNGFMQIDEVRVSDSIRSLTWIQTEYNNQNAPSSFYTVGSAEPNASFCGSGGGPSSWWNCSYDYRMAATVSTGSNAITRGYSVSVTFDHASLVSGGKSLASGDDIRVTYWNGSGWTELDRVLDPSSSWNSATTTVWFQAQAAVAAWGADTNYTINYGNASATAPPANGNNVFVRYDGFESGDFTGWDATNTATGDTLTVVGTPVYAGSNSARSTVDTVTDAQAQYWWNVTSATTYYARIYLYLDPGFFTSDHVTVMQFIDTDAGWVNIIATSINDTDDTLYLWNDLAGEAYGFQATTPITRGVWHTLEMQATMATAAGANDGAARLWMDGNLEIEATGIDLYEINTPNVDTIDRFSTGFYWANPRTEPNTIYVDEVSLRDYVHTDPLVSLDAEENSTCPSASNATGKIYWIDEGTDKIQRANLDGSNVEDLVTAADGLLSPKRLALDTLNGKMYWTDTGTDDIHRANLDGSNVEALGIAGIVDPRGIDLDVAAGKVYWAEIGGVGAIQRANLDGTGLEPLVASAGNPRGLAVDVAGGKIYWTEFTSSEIRRANLNGTGVETLVTGLNIPRGIELDVAGGKMYWTDIGAQKIQRADMAVPTAEDIITNPPTPLFENSGITLDLSAGKIYWTDYNLDHIRRANLDGSNDEDIITTGLNIPMGIEVHGSGVIVNSTGDGVDFNAGDGVCETASGNNVCTLRAAIEETNANTSIDTIEFNIPTSDPNYNITGNSEFTIQPVLALPTITDAVRIDGYTQPGAQANTVASPGATDAVLLIEIDGTNTGASIDGLAITAGSSTIRGLVINRFDTDVSSDGISLDTGDGNLIEGNYLGTNVTGVLDFGNAGDGVAISNGSSSNTVGGTGIGARNLLSGNGVYGVAVSGSGTTGNMILGNYIGTNADGSAGLGNTFSGVKLQTSSSGTTVGGTTAAERNIISGNLQHGVFIGDSTGNIVQGNYIGTDAAGSGSIANTNHGVRINSIASSNTIGGTAAGAGNVIANNTQKGISVADTVGTGNAIQRNTIYANTDIGIDLMDPGDPGNGVTPNDAGDGDSGPNNLLNYPVIYSATISGGNVTVIGEARPGATVEFFEADGDGSGYGEGQTFIDSKVEGSGDDSSGAAGSTDGTANQFTFTFPVGSLVAGDDLTATATDGSNNTSEFALNVTAAASGPTSLYRSVGTTATDLNTSAHNVTISGTTATFAGTMPDNIGVGDALAYNNGSAQLAFITGRTSSTVYTVADKDGGTPAAASNVAVGVFRSYTSLFNWEASTQNGNITEPSPGDVNPSTNLVTANTIMMVAAYGDGPDTTNLDIDSWTTGSSNYIKIYTPASISEVGNTQRHSGIWDTSKYHIEAVEKVIDVWEEYVRIEGLQIRQTSVVQPGDSGIIVNATTTAEYQFSHNIIRGVTSTSWHTGIEFYTVGPSSVAYIWNNIIYDFGNSTFGYAMNPTDPDLTSYIYNNTMYNNGNGILEDEGAVAIAKNNIAFGHTGNDYGGMDAASDNNLGEDTAFAGDANYVQTSQTAVQMFVDPSGSPRDLHILSTSDAHDAGADLSGDANLPFSDDIDGESRSGSWDIGADEQITAGTELLAKVETFTANAGTGNQIISTTGFLPKAVLFWITDQTASGSSANSRFGRGWTDGTNQAAAATAWPDGTDNTWGSMVNDKSILLINGSGTILADASIVSLNVDGFTINWSTAGGSRLVTYLALGGPGLTDVKSGLDGCPGVQSNGINYRTRVQARRPPDVWRERRRNLLR